MATPGQLVKAMAEVLGVPAATVSQYDRVLAENGFRSKGGRGLSAARVTAGDAANLLIAIMGSPVSGAAIKDAAEVCKRYGALPNLEQAAMRPNLRVYGLSRLAKLPENHTFHEALAVMIEGLSAERLMIGGASDDQTDEAYAGADHLLQVRVDRPRPRAEIFVDSGAGGDPRKWGWLVYSEGFRPRPKRRSRAAVDDLHQRRQVTFRTIRRLSAALHEAEGNR